MEHLKQWSKPREDMECDDLKVYVCYVMFSHTRILCAYVALLMKSFILIVASSYLTERK